MNDRTPDSIKVSASVVVSTVEHRADKGRLMTLAQSNLREQITRFIASEKIETIPMQDCVVYRMELYVATPAEFWNIVNMEAMRLATQYGVSPPESPQ